MKKKYIHTANWYAGVLKLRMKYIRSLENELETLKPTSLHVITEDDFHRIVRLGGQLGVARNNLERDIDEFYEQETEGGAE